MARVLVYTPTYDDLLQPQTVASVEGMRFDAFDWVVSDENPYPGRDMRNVVAQFHKGRRLALDGGYEAMLIVEHDMIVPVDALQRLWGTEAGVVYGTYQLRHGMHSVNLFQYKGNENLGMSLSLYPRELQAARRQGWCPVSGAGFGCLLIKRDVLERIPFRDTGNAPDLPFATDCVKRKIRQIGRLDVICGHIDIDQKRTLWPFKGGGYGMVARVLANQDVTVRDGNQSIVMKRGRYYSIELDQAKELQRAAFVIITNDADGVAEEIERETATDVQAEARETTVSRKTSRRKRSTKSRQAKSGASGNSDKTPS